MPSHLRIAADAGVQIRRALPDDARFIEALAGRVFLTYGSYDRYLSDWFQSETVATHLALIEETPAGFIMLTAYPHPRRHGETVADLLAIAVSPEFQSRGLGSALLGHALEEAKKLPSVSPIREIRLSVAEHNERGKRLFNRYGFRFQNVSGVYPAGQRAFQMVRALSESESESESELESEETRGEDRGEG